MTLLAMTCAALAAVVALAPAPGVARLRSVLRHRAPRRLRRRTGSRGPAVVDASAEGLMDGLGRGRVVDGSGRGLVADGSTGRRAERPGRFGRPTPLLPAKRSGGLERPDRAAAPRHTRGLAAAIAGVAAVWLIGGAVGFVAGAGVVAGAWYGLGRLEPAARKRERERVVAMLPLAADLMTTALSAGCPPAVAAETVGAAIGGPLGRALIDAAAAANVGVEPGVAWADLAAEPAVRPLARALTAAMTRGTSPSPVLERVSADARDAARWAGEARARSLGARAAAPLGLCFLPAFVLVGVVPVIATSGPLLL